MGTRLGKYTADNTKCMLSINGKTLIERALEALSKAGIKKCIMVVGYKKDNLMDFIGSRYLDVDITYIANDVYFRTNNIYSLFLAKDYLLQGDCLLLESDLIFEDTIIKELLENPEPTLAVLAKYESWMDGTVVRISDDNIITSFIPKKLFNYRDKDTYYKTVNIYKFSKEFLATSYVPFLEAYTKTMGNNEYYEQVLGIIVLLDKKDLKAMILKDHKWYEIDDVQDKDIAETIFSKNPDDSVRRIESRFGGYWRFPKLLDFCYLVNPYFPNERLLDELKDNFHTLLSQYPSGLNVQNLLLGKLFNIDEKNILAGNGAGELIHAAAPSIHGKIGIIYPTFNEYYECLKNNGEIVSFYPPRMPEDMSYNADDLLKWSSQVDALIVINPDNPSGNFIPAKEILRVLDAMKAKNKLLVLDESFVDFSDNGDKETLLQQETLEKYPLLVVIKSLSKSYGIPGLRLGALASANKEFIAATRKNLPIWNINSFAEYFLQIFGKYSKDYKAACKLIATERSRFKSELEKTGLFKIFPSQANYFLCRLSTKFSAKKLIEYLLTEHNILIKDLSSKKGLENGNYIRLAIRNRADNDILIEKLVGFSKTL